MSKRNVWSGEETMELLEIIKEKNVMELFASNTRGNKELDVYKMLEEEMKKNGFDGKDAAQIYHKWKNLKRAFYQSKKMNKGRPACEFSEELSEILDQTYRVSRHNADQPEELIAGVPAPVKKRSCCKTKTVRGQIIAKLDMVQNENTEEFAKKYNDLYDYEFKLYKRKEKEQTIIFNRMVEQSKSKLMERCRALLMTPETIVEREVDELEDSNAEEIEATLGIRNSTPNRQFYKA